MEKSEAIKLEVGKQYVYEDILITVTTDFDFTPLLKIKTIDGELLIRPSSCNEAVVKSSKVNDD
jgi:hypothetical protein